MKSLVVLASALVLSAPAFANTLDLSNSVSSISCVGIEQSNLSVNYDATSKVVALTDGKASSVYALESLKKGVAGSVNLVAVTADGSEHMTVTIRPNGARSLVQVKGTYFYATCEVK